MRRANPSSVRAAALLLILTVVQPAAAERRQNPVLAARRLGQSIWYDNLARQDLRSGRIRRLITKQGIRGITTNPTIFEKAITSGAAYDPAIRRLAKAGRSTPEIYESLVIDDVRRAADQLRHVHAESGGEDGFVSLEVNPHHADDVEKTVAEGRRLHAAVARPNVMIKVPATAAGIRAMEELVGQGISVNATLIFSRDVYAKVMNAYLAGLEKLVARGGDPSRVASVASLFVSRIDGVIDPKVKDSSLAGQAAIANARLAYRDFRERFAGARFQTLQQRGARAQRLLLASTGTKNPAYPDTLYVDSLIGADTVNTVPDATLKAFLRRGRAASQTLAAEAGPSEAILDRVAGEGIDLGRVSQDLLADGLKSFTASYDKLHQAIEGKVQTILR
jgi:transaldolase/glucose-6-phosphate isomerase